jgi:lipoyltransferase 1
MNKLLSAIGWEYLRTKPLVLEDGFDDLVQQQKGFQFVNPTEDWFPGIYRRQFLILFLNLV